MKSSAARAIPPASSNPQHDPGFWTGKITIRHCCIAAPIAILLATLVIFISANWPYRYRKIQPMLEEVLASNVKIGHYHRVYFPHPGFMATDITLTRKSAAGLPPLGTARSVMLQGTWLDLLTLRKRVHQVDITGLHIVIPPIGSDANHKDFPAGSSADFGGPTAAIEQLILHDSTLDIMRADGSRFSFPIQELTIRDMQKGQALKYDVDMRNAKPNGRILSTGSFGPINSNNLGSTPLSGQFTFSQVSLHDLGEISGTLSSKGQFQGTLAAIDANAASNTPDFSVDGGKPTPASASVHCTINGVNGDIVLHSINATTGATTINVQGGIIGSPKVADIDVAVVSGRVQDIMRPFMTQPIPVAGTLSLHGHAHLDPDGNGLQFLQRLKVDGAFDAPAEHLTDRATEQKLSTFSQRAQGVKVPSPQPGPAGQSSRASSDSVDVASSIAGQAKIRNGIASTQRLTFQMPGVAVDLSGTFNLHNSAANLTGNIRMQSDISHATTGFKSVLMKPLIPFFKKKNAGAVIPIAITGSPGSYKVTQNLTHTK